MDNEKRKILVTGANGFVGSALVGELQNAAEYTVFGLTGKRKNIGNVENPSLQKYFQADISDYETLKNTEKLKNIETVVHAAGLAHQFGRVAREDFRKVNVQGTRNICRLAQKLMARHFILISSVAVYGDYGNASIDETFICRPNGFYGESKLESENLAGEFCEKNNIRLTILRLATVVGEGDRGNTSRLITMLDRGRFLWVGKGSNKKSLIYKNDVARGILRVCETARTDLRAIYNLTAEAVSMQEVVDSISQNLHKKAPRVKIPEGIARGFFYINKTGITFEGLKKLEKTLEKWLSDDVFSGEKFNERFNFKPQTPISEAIARQVKYYLNEKRENLQKD